MAPPPSRDRLLWFRYLAYQLPGLLLLVLVFVFLNSWLRVPGWIGVVVCLVWVLKDLLLYPLVRDAYRRDERQAEHRLIGEVGVAVEDVDPAGYVRIGRELWLARLRSGGVPLAKGERVRVRGLEGMTVLVDVAGPDNDPSRP